MKFLRKPMFWFSAAMWLISIVLSALLIQLGSLVMADIPTAEKRISRDDFINQSQLSAIDTKLLKLENTLKTKGAEIADAKFRLKYIGADYNRQLSNFDNWVKTRETTKTHTENQEVVQRVELLEHVKAIERAASQALETLEHSKISMKREFDEVQSERQRILLDANAPYQRAKEAEVLKVFLFRLALTLPLLLVGGWLLAKKRSSRLWPIYRGFIIFALFAFFVELVPYMPSYGGYVRYAVGIIISLALAQFLMKWRDHYKQKQQKPSKPQRSDLMTSDAAKRKISRGICPNCDNSFRKRRIWFKTAAADHYQDFCTHCGFSLFESCDSCGTRANSLQSFCGTCGTSSSSNAAVMAT